MSSDIKLGTDVKCLNCKSAIRVGMVIKLKNRYCCPVCFSTVKVIKKKGE